MGGATIPLYYRGADPAAHLYAAAARLERAAKLGLPAVVQSFGQQALELLTLANLRTLAYCGAAWVLATVVGGPIGIGINIILAGLGMVWAYDQVVNISAAAKKYAVGAYEATDEAGLAAAGSYFASAVAEIGLATLQLVVLHKIFTEARAAVLKFQPIEPAGGTKLTEGREGVPESLRPAAEGGDGVPESLRRPSEGGDGTPESLRRPKDEVAAPEEQAEPTDEAKTREQEAQRKLKAKRQRIKEAERRVKEEEGRRARRSQLEDAADVLKGEGALHAGEHLPALLIGGGSLLLLVVVGGLVAVGVSRRGHEDRADRAERRRRRAA